MLSSSSIRPFSQFPHRFAGESSLPPTSTVTFRQSRPSAVVCSSAATTISKPASAPSSFYEVLGIPMGATNNEIKSAYRKLVRVCHPDVAAIDDKSSSADEFMKVHTAYCTLSDPEKRADYDRRIFRNNRGSRLYSMSSPTMPRYSGYVSRNWETDQCW
ncbi:OLC1v1011047C1 [Oldenlandia corymbosa var. corymbosa]|uniref:OLC1v1011047C1 n=1 Tax=Oldenlandia corymbosa var. corymbosa TaxID=529605 RepID=A0AAV1DSU2_OLDCO|nr:OLC1v1011047C1 [Oldenlandia corymbosa var. corymbosa]